MDNIEKLMSNDDFLEKLLSANSEDEVKNIFSENGVTVDDNQIKNLQKSFSEKLSEIDVGNISGGKMFDKERIGYSATSGLGHGGSIGMWVGAGVGAVAGVIDASRKIGKGKVQDTWGFIKEALKVSIKASFLGGAVGAGLGVASGPLHELGRQSDEKLKSKG